MVRSERLFALVVLLTLGTGCRVTIPEGALFTCAEDVDCGGDGYVCAPRQGASGVCCLSAAETCNGLDDDCDGQVDNEIAADPCYSGPEGSEGVGRCRAGTRPCEDGAIAEACAGEVLPIEEQCNGEDDDCDGQVDEGFDLQNNRNHCGGCNIACADHQHCQAGQCRVSGETACDDGLDNNMDGLVDCADPLCDGRPCGAGCVCAGALPTELDCIDGIDNDADGLTDCEDPECGAQPCMASPASFTCDAQLVCSCGGNPNPAPEAACGNGEDDDCDGLVDCADPDCATQSCGTGCVCTGGARSETSCGDGVDNDGDGQSDCADADCADQSCGTGCVCTGGARTEQSCGDGVDNDGDGLTDCQDLDCGAKSCMTAPATFTCDAQLACSCGGNPNPPPETACSNGQDEDCDGLVDCADPDCATQACGTGCVCQGGVANEVLCDDRVDNDGDGAVDCADQVDCPAGTACTFLQGMNVKNGFCQANGTCKQ